jgi:flagellar motor switch protein FliM
MIAEEEPIENDPGARRLNGAMLEHSGLPVERMPGLAAALEGFIAEAPKRLTPLVSRLAAAGAIEPAQSTTLSQALGDCAGLTAAIYVSSEPEARMLIALDERIDDLIVASIFGESVTPRGEERGGAEDDAPRPRTAIEMALVEEFARGLGRAIETGFAPTAPISLSLERLVTLTDAFALGRRDMPAAAARFSLPMSGGVCEGLVLLPQSLLSPFRKALERERVTETPSADRRWSHSMESGLKQTRLPVTAILEDLAMNLGDVANLRIGAVLPLQSGDFDSVRLECAGRGMFLCRLGQGDGRYRLEIETAIAQPLESFPA